MPSGPWSYAKTSVCREPASTTKALGIETRAANLTGEMHLGGSEEGESEERCLERETFPWRSGDASGTLTLAREPSRLLPSKVTDLRGDDDLGPTDG